MKMALRNFYLAFSLPLLAFISIYWYRQYKRSLAKKPDSNNSFDENESSIALADNKIAISTVESANKPVIDESITDKSAEMDQDSLIDNKNLPTIELKDELISNDLSLINKSTTESTNEISLNNNDYFKLDQQPNDELKNLLINNKSIDEKILINKCIDSLAEDDSANDSTKSNLEKNTTYQSHLNYESNNVDEETRLTHGTSKLNDKITGLVDQSAKLDNDNLELSNRDLQLSIENDQFNNEFVEEGENLFETNLSNNSKPHSPNESMHFTANTTNTTNLTFDTACDSSINTTINSLKDTTLNAKNYSTKTLLSSSSSSLNKSSRQIDEMDVIQNAFLNEDELRQSDKIEDVKAIYLNESKQDMTIINNDEIMNNTNLKNESSRTIEAKDSKIDELNFKINQQARNSFSSNSTEEFLTENTIIHADEIFQRNNDEKYLNVTEVEFKNDSKIEIVNEIVEEIKNKIEEKEVNDKENENLKNEDLKYKNLNDKIAENEINCPNKSIENNEAPSLINESIQSSNEDDSICIVYESAQQGNLASNDLHDSKAASSNKSKDLSSKLKSPSKVNLDDSSDLEIVFESCNKPKQLNGHQSNQNNNRRSFNRSPNFRQTSHDNKFNSPNLSTDTGLIEYVFEIPQALCGLLIGKQGSFINNLMARTNTQIYCKKHPFIINLNLCIVKAKKQSEMDDVLNKIRQRFPISKFPQLTLDLIDNPSLADVEPLSQAPQLNLPEGVTFDVLLSEFLTPAHLFLQQPTHPTFNLLQRLDEYLISIYKFNDTPRLDMPSVGVICTVQKGEGWYRAIVTNLIDQDNCTVRLLDYGGFLTLSNSSLHQVKREFMTVPFQAAECVLSNVQPVNGIWTNDAYDFFREVACKQLLQCFVVDYTEQGIPKIYLNRIVNGQPILINKELCERGFAIWLD